MSEPQKLHPTVEEVLARIEARSADSRAASLNDSAAGSGSDISTQEAA